jgi:hypothetical protein
MLPLESSIYLYIRSNISDVLPASFFGLDLKINVAALPETLVPPYHTTGPHILKERIVNSHRNQILDHTITFTKM